MSILINWLVGTLAVIVAAYLMPGVSVAGFTAALLTALVLGILNAFIRPVLMFLTLPINLITFGLFTFVINAILVLIASAAVPGFEVGGFLTAILFAIVLSIIMILVSLVLPTEEASQ
jgi:putative membrane protein